MLVQSVLSSHILSPISSLQASQLVSVGGGAVVVVVVVHSIKVDVVI